MIKNKPDSRKALFLKYYFAPSSDTFSNAYKSAIRAGYAKSYAVQIKSSAVNNKWIKVQENIGIDLVKKAEISLWELLNITPKTDAEWRIMLNVTKFVLERLHRGKYGKRTNLSKQYS